MNSPEAIQRVYDTTYYVVFNLGRALTALLQRDSFLYWPVLVSSGVLAALAWRWTVYARSNPEHRSWKQFFRDYFGAHIWWHRSARADYMLYLANALLLPLVFGFLLMSEKQVAGWLETAMGGVISAPDAAGIPV